MSQAPRSEERAQALVWLYLLIWLAHCVLVAQPRTAAPTALALKQAEALCELDWRRYRQELQARTGFEQLRAPDAAFSGDENYVARTLSGYLPELPVEAIDVFTPKGICALDRRALDEALRIGTVAELRNVLEETRAYLLDYDSVQLVPETLPVRLAQHVADLQAIPDLHLTLHFSMVPESLHSEPGDPSAWSAELAVTTEVQSSKLPAPLTFREGIQDFSLSSTAVPCENTSAREWAMREGYELLFDPSGRALTELDAWWSQVRDHFPLEARVHLSELRRRSLFELQLPGMPISRGFVAVALPLLALALLVSLLLQPQGDGGQSSDAQPRRLYPWGALVALPALAAAYCWYRHLWSPESASFAEWSLVASAGLTLTLAALILGWVCSTRTA